MLCVVSIFKDNIVIEFVTPSFYVLHKSEDFTPSVWEMLLDASPSGVLPNKLKQFREYRQEEGAV
jgi:hypothetical protein